MSSNILVKCLLEINEDRIFESEQNKKKSGLLGYNNHKDDWKIAQ